jgi:hypothetical protein
MSLGPTFTVPQGTSRDFLLQVKDAADAPITTFLATDTLTATVWPGDDRAAVATPTAAWDDYATGKYLLTFADATTATVTPAKYRLRVSFTRGSRTGVLLDGWLVVSATKGTATAGQAKTTIDDLLRYAPWLDDLMSDSDQGGFQEQQARAFSWLVDVLCDRWRPAGTASLGDRLVIGYDYADGPSVWLRGKLTAATSALVSRGKTVEILAKKAIAFVCEAQIGRESARDFAAHANAYHGDADSLLKTYRAEIDTKDTYDGVPTMTIHCGTQSLR